MTTRGIAIAAIAVIGAATYFGWVGVQKRRKIDAIIAAELALADASRAEQVRSESAAERAEANAVRAARVSARVEQALLRLSAEQPSAQCDGALQLARLGAREHRAALVAVLWSTAPVSVRACTASALVTLGEPEAPMRVYEQCANGDDHDLLRTALTGFGEIGPPAAAIALPHLTEALRSPYMDVRYLAVDALSKLGSAGTPLIESATNDADPHVRALAARVLARAGAAR